MIDCFASALAMTIGEREVILKQIFQQKKSLLQALIFYIKKTSLNR